MHRNHLRRLVEHPLFERAILGLILVNAITLGLETNPWMMQRYGAVLTFADRAIVMIFCLEIAARLAADFRGLWRDPWRIFDLAIVGIALIPATGGLSAPRVPRPAGIGRRFQPQSDSSALRLKASNLPNRHLVTRTSKALLLKPR